MANRIDELANEWLEIVLSDEGSRETMGEYIARRMKEETGGYHGSH